ncbi:uncharacterized protein LOC110407892 isoform X2 [Numida meleagris]|uniref:uncharacterized protein LOC110407892 isoform X2 n=1 Tax=Numida meleagris TaxID=8996 RepID=UPI000B3D87DE|nr:uncharacterized protein LOC110407892 isoform X2 [Numida meleagris]
MGLGGERRERSAARRGAAAAGTERGPTGRVVAGGGRRLHNSPVAARRFLRGEVRAARPAPLPGTGPSAAGALGETIFVIQPCLSQPAARPSVGFHGKLPSKTRRKGVTAGVTQPQLEASVDEAEKGGTLPTSLVPLGQQGPGTAPNVFHSSLVPKSQCISAHGKAEHRNKTWTSKSRCKIHVPPALLTRTPHADEGSIPVSNASEPLRCLRPVLLRDTGAGEAAAGPQCRLDRGEQTSLQCLLRAVPR